MTNNHKNIEILAPCGSYDILTAAVKAGADACYIGGIKFGARAYATNLSDDSIIKAIDYAHLHNVKLYLTVNTLLKNNEIKELYNYLKPYYEAGLDAVIVQDLGVFDFVKENFPDISIHCSTQMNITSPYGAEDMKKKGASRIVTAREMSLEEIKGIKEKVDIEIESFVHGAMCYSYSGQCLMSSLAGGRSGNRGRCAQPCRKCYKDKYYLSMKDMCTLEILPDIIESGIDSLKIEGRMKNEYYVASAVDAYKELCNDYLSGDFSVKKAIKYKEKLGAIYNRGGFCDGYYFMHNGPDMISSNRPNNQGTYMGKLTNVGSGKVTIELEADLYKQDVLELALRDGNTIDITSGMEGEKGELVSLNAPNTKNILLGQSVYRTRCNKYIQDISENILNKTPKLELMATFTACVGDYIYLTLQHKHHVITVTSQELVSQSKNKAADIEQIKSKLDMLGNTDFYFSDIYMSVDDNAFVPMGLVKQLRREAIDKITEAITNDYRRTSVEEKNIVIDHNLENANYNKTNYPIYVSVKTIEQLRTVFNYPIYAIYISKQLYNSALEKNLIEKLVANNIKIYIELPYIITSKFDIIDYVPEECQGIYIRNIDGYCAYKMHMNSFNDKDIVLASSLYGYNNLARKELSCGIDNVIFELPKELSIKELSELKGYHNQLNIYGHQQVMLSAQCVIKTIDGCNKAYNTKLLQDDMGNSFYFMANCDECCNLVYNGVPTTLLHKFSDGFTQDIDCDSFKVDFTIEDEALVTSVMEALAKLQDNLDTIEYAPYRLTTGHYYRGVD